MPYNVFKKLEILKKIARDLSLGTILPKEVENTILGELYQIRSNMYNIRDLMRENIEPKYKIPRVYANITGILTPLEMLKEKINEIKVDEKYKQKILRDIELIENSINKIASFTEKYTMLESTERKNIEGDIKRLRRNLEEVYGEITDMLTKDIVRYLKDYLKDEIRMIEEATVRWLHKYEDLKLEGIDLKNGEIIYSIKGEQVPVNLSYFSKFSEDVRDTLIKDLKKILPEKYILAHMKEKIAARLLDVIEKYAIEKKILKSKKSKREIDPELILKSALDIGLPSFDIKKALEELKKYIKG